MKQTPVEWLEEQINKFHNWKLNPIFDENCFDEIELLKAIQQAKEMENQQKGYSEEEVLELVDALNKISQFSDVGNDFLAVVQIKSIAIDAIKQFKNK